MFRFMGHMHMELCPGSGLGLEMCPGLEALPAAVAGQRLQAAAVLHVM